MSGKVVKIENNTVRPLILPGTPSYPKGKKLVPGLNTVEAAYFEELETWEKPGVNKAGKPVVTRPGATALQLLKESVRIDTDRGPSFGPMITVYADLDRVKDRPDGPEIPSSLETYKPQAALALIAVTNDLQALHRWADDRRKEVSAAAKARLNLLKGVASET
jgi:hypothetical protein